MHTTLKHSTPNTRHNMYVHARAHTNTFIVSSSIITWTIFYIYIWVQFSDAAECLTLVIASGPLCTWRNVNRNGFMRQSTAGSSNWVKPHVHHSGWLSDSRPCRPRFTQCSAANQKITKTIAFFFTVTAARLTSGVDGCRRPLLSASGVQCVTA